MTLKTILVTLSISLEEQLSCFRRLSTLPVVVEDGCLDRVDLIRSRSTGFCTAVGVSISMAISSPLGGGGGGDWNLSKFLDLCFLVCFVSE